LRSSHQPPGGIAQIPGPARFIGPHDSATHSPGIGLATGNSAIGDGRRQHTSTGGGRATRFSSAQYATTAMRRGEPAASHPTAFANPTCFSVGRPAMAYRHINLHRG